MQWKSSKGCPSQTRCNKRTHCWDPLRQSSGKLVCSFEQSCEYLIKRKVADSWRTLWCLGPALPSAFLTSTSQGWGP